MRRPSVVAAVLLSGALLLTACGGGDDGAAETSGSASGSSSTDGSSGSAGGDEPTSNESSDGQVDVVEGELPDGFPEAEVPLADGDIITAAGVPGDNGGFAVTLKIESFEDGFNEAIEKLEDAGFTEEARNKLGEFETVQMVSDDYTAIVSGGEGEGQAVLTYGITPNQ